MTGVGHGDVYRLSGAPYNGHELRIVTDNLGDLAAEIRGPGETRWAAAPLRHLARAYAVGEGPWPWLRAHGIRRPTPSGTQADEADRSRQQVKLRLSVDERAALDALAARWGCSLSEAVARAVREAR